MTKQFGSENIKPYNEKERKGIQVKRMFDSIASTYDRLNHTLSFGLDKRWRQKAIKALASDHPTKLLDIATGTGDLAIALCKHLHPSSVIGADLSEGMMDAGREKAKKQKLSGVLSFEYQDCTALTYPNDTFDAVTAAFGVRNFEDIELGLREMCRVTRPGGKVVILELSTPTQFPIKPVYSIYAKWVIPLLGKWISSEGLAYNYLPASIKVMPQGEKMVSLLRQSGFSHAKAQTMTFGVCSLYIATKE